MKACLLIISVIFMPICLASEQRPTHKRVKKNFNLDTEYLARIMVDLIINSEYIVAISPKLVHLMHLIPDKCWNILDDSEVRHVMHRYELEFYHVLWMRKKLAIHLDKKLSMIELAAILARLENAGVNDFLFDGII